jgi:FkbH-like protein
MVELSWLPEPVDFRRRLREVSLDADDNWAAVNALANTRLDFVRTNQLDQMLGLAKPIQTYSELPNKPVRLALLGSCTMAQLHAAIRAAGARRNIPLVVYEAEYGQYWQELSDRSSALYEFDPTVILLSLDAHHLAAGVHAAMTTEEADRAFDEVTARLKACWRLARDSFQSVVIHQTPLPVHPNLIGSNEHRLPGSKANFIVRLNAALRPLAHEAGVELLALDDRAAHDGIASWHDAGLWHRAKQEVAVAAAPMYGELVVRIIAAGQGRSYKCLVLDLDNTLWGGVVGDDGLEGIVLGQGSALGEAYAAFQEYTRELSRRGVILAVCSKNDEANALEPFDKHPEMVLRRSDIACFVANWSDKATNIRTIAAELNIGLDSLVFVDDNPFERNLVRQELPMVAVPEVGDDPVHFIRTISDAGYFEALSVTQEDRERTGQYHGNRMREALRTTATDLPSYLRSLEMQLIWRRFDQIGLSRTVQLINKTNQFNLTTRRYTDVDVLNVMGDDKSFGLQLRLIDRFGDNGIISIIIGRMHDGETLLIDTWLMSCRVLGRQVEPATLNLVVQQARMLGARRIVGEYLPTKKNAMVKNHYSRLGFVVEYEATDGASRATLEIATFEPAEVFIDVREG